MRPGSWPHPSTRGEDAAPQDEGRLATASRDPSFRERARWLDMQREGIGLVAGARIDLGNERIMAGDVTIRMTGEPLDDLPARRHVADVVDDRKRTTFLQVGVIM